MGQAVGAAAGAADLVARQEHADALASIDVDLPHSGKSLGIEGKVAWAKRLKEPGGNSMVVGVKFKSLDQDKQDLLNVYCFGIDNEEALMWSLWENYMG